jgi:hypothetical protein
MNTAENFPINPNVQTQPTSITFDQLPTYELVRNDDEVNEHEKLGYTLTPNEV